MKKTMTIAIAVAQPFLQAGIPGRAQEGFGNPKLKDYSTRRAEGKTFVVKHLFLICLFGCFTFILQSQPASDGCWQWQNPTGGRDIFFVNNTTGWAVGHAGTILRTTDGGASWQQQLSGTEDGLESVFFADSLTGWAAGSFGKILKTSNGGLTWDAQATDAWQWLSDVFFINNQVGWVVGAGYAILQYSKAPSPQAGFTWAQSVNQVQFSNTSVDALFFFWDFGDGHFSIEESPQHSFAVSGEYLVKLTIADACGGISDYEEEISITVPVSEQQFLEAFLIYPNPAGDFFNIRLEGQPGNFLVIDLIGLTGQKVWSESLDFQSGTILKAISCENLPKGLYLVRVADARRSSIRKIIIQ